MLDCDWTRLIPDAGDEDLEDKAASAAQAACLLFACDDEARLHALSEAFSPVTHKSYFGQLRAFAKVSKSSPACLRWLSGQKLLRGPQSAALNAAMNNDCAALRKLALAPKDAFAAISEAAGHLNANALDILLDASGPLPNAASFEAFCSKNGDEAAALAYLRKISGRDANALRLLSCDSRAIPCLAKMFIEKGHRRALHELIDNYHDWVGLPYKIPSIPAPWGNDPKPVILDGPFSLILSEWAALCADRELSATLALCSAPAPSASKVAALLPALARIADTRVPGAAKIWLAYAKKETEEIFKSIWSRQGAS